ncbi:MAG TPA: C39 family peptidase [Candidatus Dormibacteraeota bacterium]|nr:C39 family peptidase [Candidatus Dormibacteraeota bacterium]
MKRPPTRVALAVLVLVASAIAPLFAGQDSALWINVPYVAQVRDGCGSATISMVLQYWAKKQGQPSPPFADPVTIQSKLYSPKDHGITTTNMEAYFRHSGYRVFVFQGEWSDLAHHIRLGRPLIVGLRASGPIEPLHYVVVVGIDVARGFVFINDPAQAKMLRVSRQGFESEWEHTHNWTLLALPAPRE